MMMRISTDASEQYHNSISTKSSKIAASKLEAWNLTRRVYRVVLHIENSCRERMSSYASTLMLQRGLAFNLESPETFFPSSSVLLSAPWNTISPSESTGRLAASLGYYNLTLRIHRAASSFPRAVLLLHLHMMIWPKSRLPTIELNHHRNVLLTCKKKPNPEHLLYITTFASRM